MLTDAKILQAEGRNTIATIRLVYCCAELHALANEHEKVDKHQAVAFKDG